MKINVEKAWFWVALSGGLHWLAFSMIRPTIALYAASQGIDKTDIGMILAVFALLPMLLAIPSGGIADTLGRKKVLCLGAWLMLISGFMYLFSSTMGILILAQIFAGVGQMGVWLVVQILIIQEKNPKLKASRLATFSLYMALGQLSGPVVSGFLSDQFGYSSVFLVYIFICALLIYTSRKCEETEPVIKQKLNFKKVYRRSGELMMNIGFLGTMLCTFVSLYIVDVRVTSLPLFLNSLQIGNTEVGILIALGSLSALFVKPLYPVMVDKLGTTKLLLLTFGGSLSLLFFTPFLTNIYSLGILIFLTGMALSVNQPLTLSLISLNTRPEEMGIGVGLRLMANRASQLLDPLFFGYLILFFDFKHVFLFIGGFLILLSVLTVMMISHEESCELAH